MLVTQYTLREMRYALRVMRYMFNLFNFYFYFTDNLPQFFTPSTPLPSFAQFNNTVNSMGYQNNIDDDVNNDIEK